MSLRVGSKRYKLGDQLGAGAFGEIYAGVDVQTGQEVAIKLEHDSAEHPQLAYEARVYQQLKNSGMRGIPDLLYSGEEGKYSVLVLERLGSNLETTLADRGRQIALPQLLLYADQMLQLVEGVHDQGFVHRDIKPENFMLGRGSQAEQLFIIDFGLSKCFWNPLTDAHIPFRADKHLTGTARYASINNHKGFEQSRRDDLESLGYVLLYLLQGKLPWQNQQGTRREKYSKMQAGKEASLKDQSLFRNLPPLFKQYFDYVRSLNFDDRPDYLYLRSLFRKHLKQLAAAPERPPEPKPHPQASTHA
jgi:serine/threonine protein kinase